MTPPSLPDPDRVLIGGRRGRQRGPVAAGRVGAPQARLGWWWCQLANGGGPGRTAPLLERPVCRCRLSQHQALPRGILADGTRLLPLKSGAGAEGAPFPAGFSPGFRPESTGPPHPIKFDNASAGPGRAIAGAGQARAGECRRLDGDDRRARRKIRSSGTGCGASKKAQRPPRARSETTCPRKRAKGRALHQSPALAGGFAGTQLDTGAWLPLPSTTGFRSQGNWGGLAGVVACCGIGANLDTDAADIPETEAQSRRRQSVTAGRDGPQGHRHAPLEAGAQHEAIDPPAQGVESSAVRRPPRAFGAG